MLTALSIAETYRSNSAPGVGVARVFGFDKYFFISSNACCCGGPHVKFLFVPFRAWNIGRLCSANFEINLFKAASLPVNF